MIELQKQGSYSHLILYREKTEKGNFCLIINISEVFLYRELISVVHFLNNQQLSLAV